MAKPVNIVDRAMEIARTVRRAPKKSAKKKGKKPAIVVTDVAEDVSQDVPIANALRLARGGGGGADSGQAANRTPSGGPGGGMMGGSGSGGPSRTAPSSNRGDVGAGRPGGAGGAGGAGGIGGDKGGKGGAGGGGGGGGGGGADSGKAAKQAEAAKQPQAKASVSPAAREPAGYSRPAGLGAAPSGVYGPRMGGDIVSTAPSTVSTEGALKRIAEGSSVIGGYPQSKIQDRVMPVQPVKLEQAPTISRNAYDVYRPSAADNVYIGADFKPSGPSPDSGYSRTLTSSIAAPAGAQVSGPSYDPLSSVRTPAPVAQASYDPLSSVRTPAPSTATTQATYVPGGYGITATSPYPPSQSGPKQYGDRLVSYYGETHEVSPQQMAQMTPEDQATIAAHNQQVVYTPPVNLGLSRGLEAGPVSSGPIATGYPGAATHVPPAPYVSSGPTTRAPLANYPAPSITSAPVEAASAEESVGPYDYKEETNNIYQNGVNDLGQERGGYFTPEQRAAYLDSIRSSRGGEGPTGIAQPAPPPVAATPQPPPFVPPPNPPYIPRDYLSSDYVAPIPPPSQVIADFNAYNQQYLKRGGRVGTSVEAALRLARSKLL